MVNPYQPNAPSYIKNVKAPEADWSDEQRPPLLYHSDLRSSLGLLYTGNNQRDPFFLLQ